VDQKFAAKIVIVGPSVVGSPVGWRSDNTQSVFICAVLVRAIIVFSAPVCNFFHRNPSFLKKGVGDRLKTSKPSPGCELHRTHEVMKLTGNPYVENCVTLSIQSPYSLAGTSLPASPKQKTTSSIRSTTASPYWPFAFPPLGALAKARCFTLRQKKTPIHSHGGLHPTPCAPTQWQGTVRPAYIPRRTPERRQAIGRYPPGGRSVAASHDLLKSVSCVKHFPVVRAADGCRRWFQRQQPTHNVVKLH
jgi:hypothetical protein